MRCTSGSIRCSAALLILCIGTVFGSAQQHERKRIEREEITRLERTWRQAELAGDVPTMDKLLSDEFLGVTAAGQVVTKAQQLDRMRTHNLMISRLDLSDTKMKISGNLAVVTSLAQLEGTADGAPLHGAFRYTRVYQRVGGSDWKITNFEATRVGRNAGGSASAANPPGAAAGRPPGSGPSSPGASPAKFESPQSPS